MDRKVVEKPIEQEDVFEEERKGFKAEISSLNTTNKKLKRENIELNDRISRLKFEYDAVKSKRYSLEDDMDRQKDRANELERELNNMREDHQREINELVADKTRLRKVISENDEDWENYIRKPKFVRKLSFCIIEILGVIAFCALLYWRWDIIRVITCILAAVGVVMWQFGDTHGY